jgi:hypothetical protein
LYLRGLSTGDFRPALEGPHPAHGSSITSSCPLPRRRCIFPLGFPSRRIRDRFHVQSRCPRNCRTPSFRCTSMRGLFRHRREAQSAAAFNRRSGSLLPGSIAAFCCRQLSGSCRQVKLHCPWALMRNSVRRSGFRLRKADLDEWIRAREKALGVNMRSAMYRGRVYETWDGSLYLCGCRRPPDRSSDASPCARLRDARARSRRRGSVLKVYDNREAPG